MQTKYRMGVLVELTKDSVGPILTASAVEFWLEGETLRYSGRALEAERGLYLDRLTEQCFVNDRGKVLCMGLRYRPYVVDLRTAHAMVRTLRSAEKYYDAMCEGREDFVARVQVFALWVGAKAVICTDRLHGNETKIESVTGALAPVRKMIADLVARQQLTPAA